MNKSLVGVGLCLAAVGLLYFWYLFYKGAITVSTDPWILYWGVTGSAGIVLVLIGVITSRGKVARMPSRFCVHCGTGIRFNEEICPHCGLVTDPPGAKPRADDGSMMRRLGKLLGGR
ncbi:MAG: hypothetical protein ABSG92_06985 [Conexivisphaerales archaeon]